MAVSVAITPLHAFARHAIFAPSFRIRLRRWSRDFGQVPTASGGDEISRDAAHHERTLHYQEAIRNWTKVIELDQKNALAYFRRGLLYAALEEYAKAKHDLDEAFRLDQNISHKP